jgi:hypothetical protein
MSEPTLNEKSGVEDNKKLDFEEELVLTNNNLLDIINWLKRGAYVIIHTDSCGRFFHKCDGKSNSLEVKQYLDTHRFIYVNVGRMTGFLDDGEWEWYIKNSGFDECTCEIKTATLDSKNIPHRDMLLIH